MWLGKISVCICTSYDTSDVFGFLIPKCALLLWDYWSSLALLQLL